ncbi:MAG: signal peptide peptidase SppA [Gammaproteobacteria bacterium]|jgi:protease-4|nr:signal peptide peptidase SppA [Gammaproteobacteria bacterium]MBQ0773686.1 signal peptide peptidase SppA [Gammaproteobacteria bacterium]|tara:strand:+ start:30273 stop:31244 length:972 start_codon:yes stop_codon:yes gene_type:complete
MEPMQNNRPQNEKEWRLLEKLLLSVQDDNRKQRRWGIVFRVLTFVYLFAILIMFMPGRAGVTPSYADEFTAIVDVKGVIADGADANADTISTGLRAAFEAEGAKAVLLRINSPGGSPVQSDYVYNEIRRLRGEYPEKKVYAVITDVGASGAYYIASAADEIYAAPSSIVGSIGVIMSGFGFEKAIEKLGVERRVQTAGENKAIMDPFEPVNAKEQKHVQVMLDGIHAQFIAAVKKGRGDRLKFEQHPEVFSGLFWTGEDALALGLVDGLMSPGQVAREVIGVEEIEDFTARANPFDQFLKRFGVSIGAGVADALGVKQEMQLR